MAVPPNGFAFDSWVRTAFLKEYEPPRFFDWLHPRGPTEQSIKADVAKLRSVSEVGRAWIADRRMAIASVGPWRNTIVLPRKGEPYPTIMMKARQQGVTYSLAQKNDDN